MTNDEIRLAIAKEKGYTPGNGAMDAASLKNESNKYAKWWRRPDGRPTTILPNWPEDLVAAWELIEESPDIVSVWREGEIWYCGLGGWDDEQGRSFIYADHENGENWHAETSPRAICLAWLAWKGIEVTK